MNETKPKLRKISSHKSEASYVYGDWRISTKRCQSGDGVYTRRRSWTTVTVTHKELRGYCYFTSIKFALAKIDSGKIQLQA